jgi:hypothetical protein
MSQGKSETFARLVRRMRMSSMAPLKINFPFIMGKSLCQNYCEPMQSEYVEDVGMSFGEVGHPD